MIASFWSSVAWGDGSLVALALIAVVIAVMLFPFAGRTRYRDYRPPLFVAGVVAMPLFVAIGASLRADWPTDVRGVVVTLLLLGFWASAVWLASARTQGVYVDGLTFGPGLQFRPDLVLPGGVLLVKGVVLSGVGGMLAFQESWRLPAWSWWGFVTAFVGIVTLIPVRGMVKMLARRERFSGSAPRWQGPARWVTLIVGLSLLLYGFLAAFMGRTPVADFRPVRGELPLATALLVGSAVALAVRERWKRHLPEGSAPAGLVVLEQAWLYLSVLAFMYGTVLVFMGRLMSPQPATNPTGVALGATLLLLGATLVVGLRPRALRNELRATIVVMVGQLAAIPSEPRQAMMRRRMQVIATYPLAERVWHVGQMLHAGAALDEPARHAVDATRNEVMLELPGTVRRAMMEAMDRQVPA